MGRENKPKIVPEKYEIDLPYKHKGVLYKSLIFFKVEISSASTICPSCNSSTRDMMKSINISIDKNDEKVDVLKIISSLKLTSRPLLDPNYVFNIKRAVTIRIINIDNNNIEIPIDSIIGREIYVKNAKILVDEIICDNCFFSTEHLQSLFNQ